jgi:hypothetical protein
MSVEARQAGSSSVNWPRVVGHVQGGIAVNSRTRGTRRLVSIVVALFCAAVSGLVFGAVGTYAAGLPDHRVIEMVTPSSNHNADVYVPFALSIGYFNAGLEGTHTELPFQVATDGEAVAYVGAATVGGTGVVGSGNGNEYIARREPQGGWAQSVLQPYGATAAFYQAFSSDLSVGLLDAGSGEASTLSPGAPGGGYAVLYSHSTVEGSDGGYAPFFTTTPPESPREFITDDVPATFDLVGRKQVVFAGGSAGFGELLFEVHGALTPGAVVAPEANNLYVSDNGAVSLVNVLPNGSSEPNVTFGGPSLSGRNEEDPPDFQNVISADGSKIFWTDLNTAMTAEDPAGTSRLFVREDPVSADARTVQIDESHGPGPSGGGRFWAATPDGSLVFFTDESRLTSDSTAGPQAPDLYEYEVASGTLRDLTVDQNNGESAAVGGVVAISEDGSYLYFVAQGVLASNENSAGIKAVNQTASGEENLYLLQAGDAPRFIATLSKRDNTETVHPHGGSFGDWQPGLGHRTAEATPDGHDLVFESDNQSIDGYSPEVRGHKLEEVYRYDADDGILTCVSCSPAHQPPPFNLETEEPAFLGAFLPPSWSLTYMPRWISSDGSEVFFDSAEPLVSGDTNESQDVYEWEQQGSGECTREAGCVSLLSGGVNQAFSFLVGASANGSDVFEISRAQLTPEDGSEAYNLFDVRVNGRQPSVPPICTGSGCQGVPAPAPIFATPASVTFQGVGDFAPVSPAPVNGAGQIKAKALTHAQRLAKALRVCRKEPKRRRVVCERKAHRTYGKGK